MWHFNLPGYVLQLWSAFFYIYISSVHICCLFYALQNTRLTSLWALLRLALVCVHVPHWTGFAVRNKLTRVICEENNEEKYSHISLLLFPFGFRFADESLVSKEPCDENIWRSVWTSLLKKNKDHCGQQLWRKLQLRGAAPHITFHQTLISKPERSLEMLLDQQIWN